MASADCCRRFSRCCQLPTGCTGLRQLSPGKPCHLPPNPAEYTSDLSGQVSGFTVLGQLTQVGSLLSGSCSSVQDFLYAFLPTPPHDDAVGFESRFPLSGPQRISTASQHGMPGTPNDRAIVKSSFNEDSPARGGLVPAIAR